jgi:hypothetical protein
MITLLLPDDTQERLADVKREAFQLNRQAVVNETRWERCCSFTMTLRHCGA